MNGNGFNPVLDKVLFRGMLYLRSGDMRKLALYFGALFNVICLISFAYANSNEGTAIEFILKWGTYGSGDGQFSTPWGIYPDPQSNQ